MKKTRLNQGRAFAAIVVSAVLTVVMAATGRQAETESDPILQAMADEMERSMSQLQLKDLDKPYFVQYVVLDEDEYEAESTFGAITASDRQRARYVQAQARVGSYTFDNTEFASGRTGAATGPLYRTSVDDDYDALRRDLWLATDVGYKQAVEALSQKRAFLQNKVQEEQPPDFSKEPRTRAISPKRTMEFDRVRFETQMRNWSKIFREFPEIQLSAVSARARLTHRYIVNSEGTRTVRPELTVSVNVGASVQASDGMRVGYTIPVHARSFEALPSEAVFAAAIREMATNLTKVRTAPVLEMNYSGPVLLAGQASAEMFVRVLAPNLFGQRAPLGTRGGTNVSDLADRMNRPVLPTYLSVFDDPLQSRAGTTELIGQYEIDDQGVPAKRVSLIEDGLLSNMLMGRRPGKERVNSNGHGRSGFPGRETTQIGNLFVTAKDGKSYDELKQELMTLAKAERLQYGIVIKGVNPAGGGSLGSPVLIYKVYVSDGREELIRGASPSGIPVSSLRHIQAAGNDVFVANRLAGSQGAETPVSVVAPSILLEEMELLRPTGAQQKPAVLTHPFFE